MTRTAGAAVEAAAASISTIPRLGRELEMLLGRARGKDIRNAGNRWVTHLCSDQPIQAGLPTTKRQIRCCTPLKRDYDTLRLGSPVSSHNI